VIDGRDTATGVGDQNFIELLCKAFRAEEIGEKENEQNAKQHRFIVVHD